MLICAFHDSPFWPLPFITVHVTGHLAGKHAQAQRGHVITHGTLHCRNDECGDDCVSLHRGLEVDWAATCISRAFRAWKDRQHFKRCEHSSTQAKRGEGIGGKRGHTSRQYLKWMGDTMRPM